MKTMLRRWGIVLLTLMVLVSFSCVSAPPAVDYAELTIYHMNDTHSRVEEGKYAGMGMAKLSSYVSAARAEGGNILFLDAGDTFHGQTIATLVEGESIARITNAMGVDAMTAGNHDFNYGQERLLELDGMTDYPVLGANVLKDGEPLLTEYVIKEIDGMKVGIFGLSTPETAYKTHPNNVKGIVFEDPVVTAERIVAELRPQVNVLIALAHLGLEGDDTSVKVAEQVEGIDLIVDGHSHDTLENGKMVNGTLIVQAGSYDKNLGKVMITVTDSAVSDLSAELITKEMAADAEEDPAVLAVVDEVKADIEAVTSVVIGESDRYLDGERGNVRTGETNLGNLITEAMLDVTGADVVVTNGGGIRDSIGEGDITVGDIVTVLPFGNYVVTKEISGADLLTALEHGLSVYPEANGGFPHIAGMEVVFNPAAEAGSRIVSLTIGGTPVDEAATYVMATNDFMAAGGDNYTMFADDAILGEFDGLDEIVIDYIKAKGMEGAEITGRVKVANEVK